MLFDFSSFYTIAGFDLTTHGSSLLGGRRRPLDHTSTFLNEFQAYRKIPTYATVELSPVRAYAPRRHKLVRGQELAPTRVLKNSPLGRVARFFSVRHNKMG
jgi:hypothetical protein